MKINEVGEYIQECLRLLYWIYFKPYTLQKWLQDIHPELIPNTNPFSLSSEFRQNPRLQRYANQACWLTSIVPIITFLIVAPIYSIFTNQLFSWLNGWLLIFGWIASLLISRGNLWYLYVLLITIFSTFLGFLFIWQVSFFIPNNLSKDLVQTILFPFLVHSSY